MPREPSELTNRNRMVALRVLLVTMAIFCQLSSSDEIKNKPVLPYDVLEIFFKNLNISDLLHVAESGESVFQPAIWAFRQSYAHKVIKFNGTQMYMLGDPFVESSEMIYIRDYDVMKRVINTFGDSILKLNIGYDNLNESVVAELNSLIVEKCATKLQYLHISFPSTDLDSVLPTAIFLNVETLTFSPMGSVDNSTIDLNERFPHLERLDLGIHRTINDIRLFDRHFENLEHLGFDYLLFDDLNITKSEIVFQKNPQIKSIYLWRTSLSLLHIICENYPNLESLKIFDIQPWNEEVLGTYHFDNIRKFHLINLYQNSIVPVTFGDKLNEVIVESSWGVDQNWVQFIASNPNVQKLFIHFYWERRSSYAYLTSVNLKNLKELQLHGFDLTANEELDAFLNGLKKWTNLESVRFIEQPKNATDLLKDKFSPEWEMTAFKYDRSDEMIDIVFAKK